MKQTQRLVIRLFISLLIVVANTSYGNDVKPAPPLTSEQSLALLFKQHEGKVIYLDFWASWCGPCRKSFPWMSRVHQMFNAQGFTVISINLDAKRELAEAFLNNNPVQFPVVFDPQGTIATRYQLKGMPSSYLIGRDGEIKIAHVGFFSHKQHQYEEEIKSLLARGL